MSIMERNSTIDIMKGLAIILMLFIHAPFVDLGITLSFVVPLFFMVSGVFLPSCETCTDLRVFILKKIKSLYVPYVITNLIFLAFHNFFVRINFYTDSQDFLAAFPDAHLYSGYTIVQFMKRIVLVLTTAGGTLLGGSTWFLRSLFFSSILYEILNYAFAKLNVNKLLFHWIFGFVFLYSVSYFIDKCSVSSFFVLAGKYTIYVLCLHLLFYKFVTLIFVKLHSLPDIYIAAFPTILSLCNRNERFAYGGSYILTGLLFPLLVGLGVRRFKKGRKIN